MIDPRPSLLLRDLYRDAPEQSDAIARALASHPDEKSLPILVAALDSRDPNTTNQVLLGLARLTANPSGPEALIKLLRLGRRGGPSLASSVNRLASQWTGVPAPRDAKDFDQVLSAWEAVYRQTFPKGPAIAESGPSGGNSYSLPILVDNVLHADVMKSASGQRGLKVVEQARALDCHKFGKAAARDSGPDLTTVSSRFRPGEILESIVEPSGRSSPINTSRSPWRRPTARSTQWDASPMSEGADLVLLLSDGTKVTIPKTEIDGRKDESNLSVMPAGLINRLELSRDRRHVAFLDSVRRAGRHPARGQNREGQKFIEHEGISDGKTGRSGHMSGGVDSSVAAVLSSRIEGFDVVGIFMRTGASVDDVERRAKTCCSATDALDAQKVADRLDIPFYALDFERDFARIQDYFADEYLARGRDAESAACVVCNVWPAQVRQALVPRPAGWGRLCRNRPLRAGGPGRRRAPRVARGLDRTKDQSYVLFGLRRELLPHVLFPVGHYTKAQIRDIAREHGLPVHDKPDSQEICFVPGR